MLRFFVLGLVAIGLLGCQSKIEKVVRDTKYSLYEVMGVEKRDLFKKEVKNVQESQEDTNKAFEDALERLQKVYAVDGGSLEREYKKLKNSYEDANRRSSEVSRDIVQLNTVAQDLFTEWKSEAQSLGSAELRKNSLSSLQRTQSKYDEFFSHLKKSELKIAPVLKQLQDQVTYLKHNLNAKAVAGLKVESDRIQANIKSLMGDIEKSISQSKEFIKDLE